jgi:hypothetical protein
MALSAFKQYPEPFKRERTNCGIMRLSFCTLLIVIQASPEGLADRLVPTIQ